MSNSLESGRNLFRGKFAGESPSYRQWSVYELQNMQGGSLWLEVAGSWRMVALTFPQYLPILISSL